MMGSPAPFGGTSPFKGGSEQVGLSRYTLCFPRRSQSKSLPRNR